MEKNPFASNMGGVWEQQIRRTHSILNSLLKTHGSNLTEESLETLVVQVEAIDTTTRQFQHSRQIFTKTVEKCAACSQ